MDERGHWREHSERFWKRYLTAVKIVAGALLAGWLLWSFYFDGWIP